MKFTGSIDVPAPRQTVYEKLNDPVFFASCVEGVEDLEEVDATHYNAKLATRIAFINFRFDIAVEIVDQHPPERLTARAVGKPIGKAGRLTATSGAMLENHGDGTRVNYEIDVALSGKLGSIGQPVLKSKAREMEKGFAKNLKSAFSEEVADK